MICFDTRRSLVSTEPATSFLSFESFPSQPVRISAVADEFGLDPRMIFADDSALTQGLTSAPAGGSAAPQPGAPSAAAPLSPYQRYLQRSQPKP